MVAKYLVALVLLAMLGACKGKTSAIPTVNLPALSERYVAQAKHDTTKFVYYPLVKLVHLDWDQVSIIEPYMPSASIDSLKLTNISGIRDQIDSVVHREDKDLVVFSKAGLVVAYDIVERKHIGFDFLVKSRPDTKGLPYVFDRSYCNRLVLKINNTGSVIIAERSYIRRVARFAEIVLID